VARLSESFLNDTECRATLKKNASPRCLPPSNSSTLPLSPFSSSPFVPHAIDAPGGSREVDGDRAAMEDASVGQRPRRTAGPIAANSCVGRNLARRPPFAIASAGPSRDGRRNRLCANITASKVSGPTAANQFAASATWRSASSQVYTLFARGRALIDSQYTRSVWETPKESRTYSVPIPEVHWLDFRDMRVARDGWISREMKGCAFIVKQLHDKS